MSFQNDMPLSQRDLCFIDSETTGPMFGFHEIVEIGAVRTSPDALKVLGTWERRIKPRFPERATEYALSLNGYSRERWVDAAEPDAVLWNGFRSFVEGCVPVCHNPSFDRAFVTMAASSSGVPDVGLDYHWIGTESLAWPLYREGLISKLSLESICDYFGVPREPLPHSGLNGAETCRQAYLAILTRLRFSEPLSRLAGRM